MSSGTKKPIGSILLEQHALSAEELEAALERGKGAARATPLVSALTREGIIRETEALRALSEQSGCPGIDLNQICIRLRDLELVPLDLAQNHLLLPVLVKGDRMFVAMANPGNEAVVAELELVTGKRIFRYIALQATLRRVIGAAYLLARQGGASHFIGPNCPRETLIKAGLVPPGGDEPDTEPEPPARESVEIREESLRPFRDGGSGAVVLDPTMQQLMMGQAMMGQQTMAGSSVEEMVWDDSSETAAPLTAPRCPTPEPGKRLMLVADADVDARSWLARVFEERGFHVIQVARGDHVLQLVREHDPDVVVLDAKLPAVHGFDVAKELKGSERYSRVPLVMISADYTGWRFAADIKQSYGVDAFLEKPLEAPAIIEAVDAVLAARFDGSGLHGTGAPGGGEACRAAEPYLEAGVAAYRAGRLDEAIVHLERGVQTDPLAYAVRVHLGLLYGKQGRVYDAIQELESALNVKSDYFPALKNLAVLYQNAGFRNKAIEMWQRCLDAAPDAPTRESMKRHLVAVL